MYRIQRSMGTTMKTKWTSKDVETFNKFTSVFFLLELGVMAGFILPVGGEKKFYVSVIRSEDMVWSSLPYAKSGTISYNCQFDYEDEV